MTLGSHGELDSLLDALQVGAVVVDAQGRVVAVNSAWRRVAAEGRGEWPSFGRGWDFMRCCRECEATAVGVAEAVQRVLVGEHERTRITLLSDREKDTSSIHLQVSRFVLGGVQHALVVYGESRRCATEDPHGALEAVKSAFVSNISNELRTPMDGIIGMTDLALEASMSEEQREYLVAVRSSAHALLTLVNDLIDFSRIEGGHLELERIPFGLRASLAEAIQPLARRAQQKGLELVYDILADVPDGLSGDPGRLRQVILHLLDNAIKFTDRGTVMLRAYCADPTDDPVTLRFEVIDTGPGIDPALHDRIFDCFVDDPSRPRRGAGLGLSISRQLVHLMDGRVAVESDLGSGSRFHFTAQFARCESGSAAVRLAQPAELRGLRILVGDGNPIHRRTIAQSLEGLGMRPEGAADGPAALDALRAARDQGLPFEVAILDLHLPQLDGFALARKIREQLDLREMRLIVLSLAGQRGDAARCREVGVDGYLTKPFSPQDLTGTVQAVLARDAQSAQLVTRTSLREGDRPLRMLLATHDVTARRIAETLLASQGHHVISLAEGKAAVEAAERQRFDVILMDVGLPLLDGVEAAARIRQREKGSGSCVSIIALAEDASEADCARFLNVGMNGHLAKPLRIPDLLAMLERGRRWSSTRTPAAEETLAGRERGEQGG